MTLPKEEADTLRRCLAILAPLHGPHERRTMALNIEQRIRGESTSVLCLRYTQLAALFYPGDKEKSLELAQKMQAAADAGELATIIPASEKGAMFSDLAAWSDCPPISEESPLRYWLPYMPTPAQSSVTVKPLQRSAAQDAAILTQVTSLGYDPLALPRNKPGKAGVKSEVRNALSKDRLFTGAKVFDKAWERLSANGEIMIQK